MAFGLIHFHIKINMTYVLLFFHKQTKKKTSIYAVRFMVRDVTCNEIRGRITVHHCDDCGPEHIL
jgi:hypothetical protein